MPFRYTAYGLSIVSELECPGLPNTDRPAEVSIFIRELPHSESLLPENGPPFIAKPDFFFIDVEGVARFQVSNGAEILIDPAPEAAECDIRLYLMGSVFAALIQQRGEIALHASAVMKDGQAILFSGDSGVGKSTTALSLLLIHGWKLCADDTCRLAYINHKAHLYPAYPSMKIWNEVLHAMNVSKETLTPIQKQPGKFRMPIAEDFPNKPIPVDHIFALEKHDADSNTLHALTGSGKLMALRKRIYRSNFLSALSKENQIFQELTQLLKGVPITQLNRTCEPITRDSIELLANQIQSYLSNYST